jgi:hypothetical protein
MWLQVRALIGLREIRRSLTRIIELISVHQKQVSHSWV